MNISEPFIRRPVATSLLAAALLLVGATAYTQLPVAPLPRVDYPTINVNAALPGASPETMASAVATPLERRFGRIAGLTEITSVSSLGSVSLTLIRSGPRRGLSRARRAGRHQRSGRRSAARSAHASQLSQGQPRRRAHPHPFADVQDAAAGASLRRCQYHIGPEDRPGAGRGPGFCWRRPEPCCARAGRPGGAGWPGAGHGGRAHCAQPGHCRSTQGQIGGAR